MKKKYIIIGIFLLIIDQVTKYAFVNKSLVLIPKTLCFSYNSNSGAAFGIGTRLPIILISLLLLLLLNLYFFIVEKQKDDIHYFSYILITAGAWGNLFDRLFRKHVIDFISLDFLSFPIFNLADIYIIIGIILFLFILLTRKKETE